jgi:hypothetical protein
MTTAGLTYSLSVCPDLLFCIESMGRQKDNFDDHTAV